MSLSALVRNGVFKISAALTLGAAVPFARLARPAMPSPVTLELREYTADSNAFDVNSTLIVGPTEALLVDAQYRKSDASRVADMIAASGKHLKAVFLTHSDDDHIRGAATIVERFPGTPVYMSAGATEEFTTKELPNFTRMKAMIRNPPPGRTPPPDMVAELADSLVTPQLAPAHFSIDGVDIQVVADQQGDVLRPSNSYLWIPSQRTVIAGDIVFNGVHVWLAGSSAASREAWRGSIRTIADLKPVVVVAGHKSRADAPDTPDALAATATYLSDFDAVKAAATSPDEIMAAMLKKYPDRKVPMIVQAAARMAQ